MGIHIDESWEYFTPDQEVAELLNEQNQQIIAAHKASVPTPFAFCFAGDRTMASGRFYDGINFGKRRSRSLAWFSWGGAGNGQSNFLLQLFEAELAQVPISKRQEWLVRGFCRAWDNLPDDLRKTVELMLGWSPEPRRPGVLGRKPGVFTWAARISGVAKLTLYRRYVRAKFRFLYEFVPDSLKVKCACGCGQNVSIAYVNSAKYGHVSGRPVRFIAGHGSYVPHLLSSKKLTKAEQAFLAGLQAGVQLGHLRLDEN